MTKQIRTKPRDINIDIVKTVAIISVICIHFFAYIATYGADTKLGNTIWLELILTQVFTVCVPLFLLSTGYLMNKKYPSLSYYKKIFGVLFIYLVTSILFQIFRVATADEAITIGDVVRQIINIEGSQYSWYVEMYIGLFLFIPLLNIIWSRLETKKARGILCLALFAVCSVPHIIIKGIHLPDYWIGLWPIMFYYAGAYFKEYNFRLTLPKRLIFLLLSFFAVCLVAIIKTITNNGIVPASHLINDWAFPWIVIYSIALFSLIISLKKTQKLPNFLKHAITKISSLTLGIYLTSAIFDSIVYYNIFKTGSNPASDLKYFPFAVTLTFIGSFIVAWVIDKAWQFINKPRNKSKTIEEK